MCTCIAFGAVSGGRSPHRPSISRSLETTSFAFARRMASNARCFGPPRDTNPFGVATSSGPRIRNSIASLARTYHGFTRPLPRFCRSSRSSAASTVPTHGGPHVGHRPAPCPGSSQSSLEPADRDGGGIPRHRRCDRRRRPVVWKLGEHEHRGLPGHPDWRAERGGARPWRRPRPPPHPPPAERGAAPRPPRPRGRLGPLPPERRTGLLREPGDGLLLAGSRLGPLDVLARGLPLLRSRHFSSDGVIEGFHSAGQ